MNTSFSPFTYRNALSKAGALLMVLGLLALSGCAGTQRFMPAMARLPGIKSPFFAGQILDLKERNTISYSKLIEKLSSSDIVFVGEIHDNPDHHLIQAQILQSLRDKWGKLTLAVEFLPATKQTTLDEYIQGKTSEEKFLQKVNWRDTWGFNYHFYRPLLDYQRINSGPVIAINAPYELVKKVSRGGLISLKPNERSLLPRHIDLTDKAHRAYLKKIYEYHSHSALTNFEYFYEAQCVWEETMAKNIALYFRQNKGKILVICGNGHIMHGFGIPKRLRRRVEARVATLVPYTLKKPTLIDTNLADYVWLTGKYFRIPKRHPLRGTKTQGQNPFDKRSRKN